MFMNMNGQNIYVLSIFFSVCSIVSYAVTEIFKPVAKLYIENADLRAFCIRLVSCIVGAFVGFTLAENMLSIWVGFASGSMNTYVVDALRKYIDKKTNKTGE